jgi:hypothetical protein
MQRGTWIEYRQDDGTPLRAKLFWISPLKGLYLFTNRLGQRAISITAEGLEHESCAAAKSRLVDDAPLVERAVSHMVETLRQQQPPEHRTRQPTLIACRRDAAPDSAEPVGGNRARDLS